MERKPCPDAVAGQSTAAEVSHEAKRLREVQWVKLPSPKGDLTPVCAKVSHSSLKGRCQRAANANCVLFSLIYQLHVCIREMP